MVDFASLAIDTRLFIGAMVGFFLITIVLGCFDDDHEPEES